MKDIFLGLGIFVVLIFGFFFHIRSQPSECFDNSGNQICVQLNSFQTIETEEIFNHRFRITNNSADFFFLPMRTKAEFASFLTITNLGNQTLNIDVCRLDGAISLNAISISACAGSPPPPTPKSCFSLFENISLYSDNSVSGTFLGQANALCESKDPQSSCESFRASPAGQDPVQVVCEWK